MMRYVKLILSAMRTIRHLFLLLFCFIFLRGSGQTLQNVLTITLTDYDYSALSPVIGVVSGTAEIHFTFHLSSEGYIKSIHWNIKNCNMHNSEGVEIKMLDSGNDNLGVYWQFFNTPNASNDAIQPGISYDVPDGWLDSYMPEEMPVEGVYVENLFTFKCKGYMLRLPLKIVLHMNANGVYTVDMVKP